MKTLDEVINVCEKRCCQGCDKCPYFADNCLSYLDEPLKDALHYLKEYRDTDEYYKNAIAHVTEVVDYYEKMVADDLAVNNPPLTWDELKAMEGKPVMSDWSIEILRYPTEEDWKRCLMLARCTQGKFNTPNEPSDEWKMKILRSEHSPIRTLMFTIVLKDIPYCNSVHFVRHKYGVEHYVQSQRKNPERGSERQDAPVTHIIDINAAELIYMARKRLCFKADPITNKIMYKIRKAIVDIDPIWKGILIPACEYEEAYCREFKPCGRWA